MPETITALVAQLAPWRGLPELFVGTSPTGSVYRVNTEESPKLIRPVAVGLGDRVEHGVCEVSTLSLHDLDQDGDPELLAGTSQILPIGRPRLYIWSSQLDPALIGFVRPDIKSSWTHGLGFLPTGPGQTDSVISTYCGYGEVLQFQMVPSVNGGFQSEMLGWRQVATAPKSGEQALTADVNNDGETELCLASGYSVGNAQVSIYQSNCGELDASPVLTIDEDHRFGNVRMLVSTFSATGSKNYLIAWWCSELCNGECEIVRYAIERNTVVERTVIAQGDAAMLWPREGQMATADTDGDGNAEVWFATNQGYVWRYDPSRDRHPSLICSIPSKIGPIAAVSWDCGRQALYIGRDRSLFELRYR